MRNRLLFWYKFFRAYDNLPGQSYDKAQAVIKGERAHINKKFTI